MYFHLGGHQVRHERSFAMQKWVVLIAAVLLNLGLVLGAPVDSQAGDDKGYTIVDGSVVINDTIPQDMERHWVYIKCEHWAGCYLRCIGRLNACEKLAKTVSWEEIYLFSDKASPKKPEKPVKK